MSTSVTTSLERPATLDAGLLLARVMMSVLFIVAGYGKLMAVGRTAGYFGSLGVPMPNILVWGAIAAELGLGLLLLIGFRARWVALALALFTLLTSVIGHAFWQFDATAPQYTAQMTQFLKNLAIAGGFVVLALVGPGRFALR